MLGAHVTRVASGSSTSAFAEGKENIPNMRLNSMLPRPAMIVAVVALIAAIGGSAYAASQINGKDIKNNTVTGQQVNEKTLKTVKKAKKAKSAKNAKRLGGNTAEELKTRWLLLNEQGQIEEQSGGFTVLDAYDTNTNAYIDAGESLVGKGLTATIAIQNQIDQNPAMAGVQGNVAGEVSVSRCQITGVVDCAPANAKNVNALVVSPRNSDGTPAATASPGTGSGTASKRVYVTVTEGSAPTASPAP